MRRNSEELVECGCINPIACKDCKGTGYVRKRTFEEKDNLDIPETSEIGIVNLASSTQKGAYF
ncbi:MAG TPA: hypothetical protein DEA43_00560 [Candidatus Moranbacteria bacterium]|nr:hypothetical protein [Candidatus Moranbacteria bacterium]HBT45363.1 hypothetical protein [Candidatus Moranbacteria bacterium]